MRRPCDGSTDTPKQDREAGRREAHKTVSTEPATETEAKDRRNLFMGGVCARNGQLVVPLEEINVETLM